MFKLNASALMLALLYAPIVAAQQPSRDESLPEGTAKGKAQTACLSCHEARIIVQQRLSGAAWTKEVDKMIKWGAEVDPKDREELIDYLSANFSPNRPNYIAPKSAVEAKSKTRVKH